METLSIYEYLEDWDNPELPDDEWQEQMEDAAKKYNEIYSTRHKPEAAVRNYKSWKRDKYKPEQ